MALSPREPRMERVRSTAPFALSRCCAWPRYNDIAPHADHVTSHSRKIAVAEAGRRRHCTTSLYCGQMAPGQKRTAISLRTKCDIILEAQQGAKVAQLSRKHSLPQSTISTILKKGEKFIESACSGTQPASRKRIREGALKDVEDALFRWFLEVRARGETVNGPVLAAEATRLARELGRGDFQPGGGWIQRFKERHGIVHWDLVGRDFFPSSYAENKGEYIIPNIPEGSGASASVSLQLSDIRSLADPEDDAPIHIKEEILEESMEEEEMLEPEVSSAQSSITTTFTIPPFTASTSSAATPQLLTISEPPVVHLVTDSDPTAAPSASVEALAVPPLVTTTDLEQLLAPPETSAPQTSNAPEASTKSFAPNRKRPATPWTPPSAAERKAKMELELLLAKRKKLEAEERKAIAEAQRMTEERKKFEEEQKKLKAETEFYAQERIRSLEETRKATAIAEYHLEEKRKAAAKADMLVEHKRFYVEQQKTEMIRRKMLLFELRKMKQDLKLVTQ